MDASLFGVVIANAVLVVLGLVRVSFQFGRITKGLEDLAQRVTRLERVVNHTGGE